MKFIAGITCLLITFSHAAFAQPAIEVEKSGEGEAILFLPGFTSPGSVWEETSRNLTGEYESFFVSYAGFNDLEPIELPWYQSVRDALIDYVKDEDLSDLILIGHSMGGSLAIELALALPEKVKALVLVEAIPNMREVMMPGVPASSLQYDSPYNNQVLNLGSSEFEEMARQQSENMSFSPEKIKVLTNWILGADRETYVYGYTELLKMDLQESLGELSMDTLILGSAYPDQNVVLENYRKQYMNLANKSIYIAEDSKHFIMFDRPSWLYEKINTFLNDQK